MRRRWGLVLVVSSGLLGAAAACGGNDSTVGSGGDDGGGSDHDATLQNDSYTPPPGSDGSSGSDSNGGGDTSTGKDGTAGDGGGTDSGAGEPHRIPCGAVTCDNQQDSCCIHLLLDGGTGDASCIPNNMNCPGGFLERCDKAADCDGGRVCCIEIGALGSTCRATCGQGIQLCQTNAECPNNEMCNLLTCFNGRKLQVCGKPPGCQ
jgi:hypothetical protein